MTRAATREGQASMTADSRSCINLLKGWPAPSLLPTALVERASVRSLNTPDVAIPSLEYGPDPGHEPLRRAVADWLTIFYRPVAGPTSFERITITGGASQSLGNILSVYTDPLYTRAVWIVAPAYMLSFRVFEDAGFGNIQGSVRGKKMMAVPEDDEGVDVTYLRRCIKESEDEALRAGNTRPVGASVSTHA
jgi:DNA-binding transcriptional MocR family regulator